MGDVIRPSFGTSFEVLGELAEEIKALIYARAGEIPLAAAIGVLRIVESELLKEAE